MQAFQPGVLPINILDGQLHRDTVLGRASHGREPESLTLGLTP
jgi:hypothetical protein